MIGRSKILQLKHFNHNYPIVLNYDKCKSGESQYGAWNFYSVEHNGEEQSLFVENALHQELKKYSKGAKLLIIRNQDESGSLSWQVTPANGESQLHK